MELITTSVTVPNQGSGHTHQGGTQGQQGGHQHQVTIQNDNASHDHQATATVESTTQQSHNHESDQVGGGEAHENRPPYYALCYIIQWK